MSIRIGMPAPDVVTDAYIPSEVEALPISLADFRGQWAVLVFYPRDFTFVCPTELQALARLQEAFAEAGATVIAASTDSYYSQKAWFETDPRLGDVTYPVLADTSHRLSEAFGVLLEDGTAMNFLDRLLGRRPTNRPPNAIGTCCAPLLQRQLNRRTRRRSLS